MDKKIKNISKKIKADAKKEGVQLKELAQADKARDKVCEMGAKVMHKKKK